MLFNRIRLRKNLHHVCVSIDYFFVKLDGIDIGKSYETTKLSWGKWIVDYAITINPVLISLQLRVKLISFNK